MSNAELKPCPFCGCKAEIFYGDNAYWATCSKCEAEIMGELSRNEAIETWNRRYEKTCRMNKVFLYDEECIEGIECDECGWNEIHDHCEALPNYCPHCGGKVTH